MKRLDYAYPRAQKVASALNIGVAVLFLYAVIVGAYPLAVGLSIGAFVGIYNVIMMLAELIKNPDLFVIEKAKNDEVTK